MAKKPETLFKEKVLKQLRALPYSWWEKIQQVTLRGTPDLIGCLNGNFIAIELKRSAKAEIELLQVIKLERIGKAGGTAIIAYPENWEVVYAQLVKMSQL